MEQSPAKRKHSIRKIIQRLKITRKYSRSDQETSSTLQQPAPKIADKRPSTPPPTNVLATEIEFNTLPPVETPLKKVVRASAIGFFDLPREIRDAVYSYFPRAEWTAHFESLSSFLDNIFKFCLEPSILKLSRQISAEYLEAQFRILNVSFSMGIITDGLAVLHRLQGIAEVLNVLRYQIKDPLRGLHGSNTHTTLLGEDVITLTPNGRKCGSIAGNLHRVRYITFQISIHHPSLQRGQDFAIYSNPFQICALLLAQIRSRRPSSFGDSIQLIFGSLVDVSFRVRILCPHGSVIPSAAPGPVVTFWEEAIKTWIDKLWAYQKLETCRMYIEAVVLPPQQLILLTDSERDVNLWNNPSSGGQIRSLYSFRERKVEDGEFLTTEQAVNNEVIGIRYPYQVENPSETDPVRTNFVVSDPRRRRTYHAPSALRYEFVDRLGLPLQQISREW
jgi:hypothetical protein